MDVPQEVEGEEKAHATFDGEVGDRLDSSLIASREQMAASNRPTSSIEAPRPHKRSPTYSEEFLSETHVNQESSPFGQAARWMTDSREPPVLPRSNIVPSTALAGSNTGSSRGATRDRFSRYGAHLSCVPCRRRKVRVRLITLSPKKTLPDISSVMAKRLVRSVSDPRSNVNTR